MMGLVCTAYSVFTWSCSIIRVWTSTGSDGDLFESLPAGMKIFEAVFMVSLMNFSFLCMSAS